MSWLREGWRLENGETGERDPGQADENQKGCWAATRNQVTSANTTLLSTDPFVTFPSKPEMAIGAGRLEKGHCPRLRTGKAGMAANQGARDWRAGNCTVEWW